ncbi:MAG: hypothetical protein A2Y10_18050 [Planctomycetes bacterium GWF2_41_51]|nr:MAG: hypothetical protein A2Y10_18050 [Planctomycetes bacterium GWF2_41_51]
MLLRQLFIIHLTVIRGILIAQALAGVMVVVMVMIVVMVMVVVVVVIIANSVQQQLIIFRLSSNSPPTFCRGFSFLKGKTGLIQL